MEQAIAVIRALLETPDACAPGFRIESRREHLGVVWIVLAPGEVRGHYPRDVDYSHEQAIARSWNRLATRFMGDHEFASLEVIFAEAPDSEEPTNAG